jgi:hypothetical protein
MEILTLPVTETRTFWVFAGLRPNEAAKNGQIPTVSKQPGNQLGPHLLQDIYDLESLIAVRKRLSTSEMGVF